MKKILSKLDKPLLVVTFIFFVFGLLMILSASSMESYMRYNYSPYHYFVRQALFLIVGMFIFFFCIIFPTRNYKKLRLDKVIIGIIMLALIGLPFVGHSAKNAVSWYQIGPVMIQPSEFAKVAIILYLSIYYERNKDNLDNQWNIIKPIIIALIITALVVIQPDMGTAAIIGVITIMMFYAVPIDNKYRGIFNKLFIGGVVVVILVLITTGASFLKDYQKERFNFTYPCERYQEKTGYQVCNSLIALKNGSVNGQGLGKSTQKYLYLPESYTDFIFPIIVEEWGLIVGIVIIFAYAFVLFRIIRIARRASNLRGSLICYGVFVYLLTHIMVNLFGVMAWFPLTGVPLPFLSYGGSYTICLMISMGLVQRVAIESKKNTK